MTQGRGGIDEAKNLGGKRVACTCLWNCFRGLSWGKFKIIDAASLNLDGSAEASKPYKL